MNEDRNPNTVFNMKVKQKHPRRELRLGQEQVMKDTIQKEEHVRNVPGSYEDEGLVPK
jgi:hypothetical protein